MAGGIDRTGDRGNGLGQFYRFALGIGYERNVDGAERTVRYAAGTGSVLLGLLLIGRPMLGTAAANIAFAALLLGTGSYLFYEARVQYCPLNQTIGRSTVRPEP